MDINEIEKLYAATILGEWEFTNNKENASFFTASYYVYSVSSGFNDTPHGEAAPSFEEARLIVALINNFPQLLKQIRAGEELARAIKNIDIHYSKEIDQPGVNIGFILSENWKAQRDAVLSTYRTATKSEVLK